MTSLVFSSPPIPLSLSLYLVVHLSVSLCHALYLLSSSCLVSAGLDFEALLLKPKESKEGAKLPLIVTPHGVFE